MSPLRAEAALARLREGNRRFVQDTGELRSLASMLHPRAPAQEARPFAIVLACADSAVPSEVLFDCAVDELFVVSVAGNVVAPSLLDSVLFALARCDCELVVVLGHTRCASVRAALDALSQERASPLRHVREIAGRLGLGVAENIRRGARDPELERQAGRANIEASVAQLRRALEQSGRAQPARVLGAEHDMETGQVRFLE